MKRKLIESTIDEDFDDDKFFEIETMKEADRMEKNRKIENIKYKGGVYKGCTFNFNCS